MVDDQQVLIGRPVHICPSLAAAGGSPAVDGQIIFGDLSYFVVTITDGVEVVRKFEGTWSQSYQALYAALCRVNSALSIPAASAPPVVLAMVKH